MFTEDDYIMLSALQHYFFCPRQCALIHVEQLWAENRFTAEGKVLHERADSGAAKQLGGIRSVRSLLLSSRRLGLTGQADVVEFYADKTVVPVEYKRGHPKKDRCDEVQLCAQALCLEEMLQVDIAEGALFYGQKRRRKVIPIDDELRALTEQTISQVHELIRSRRTPAANYGPKCDQCSLYGQCLPKSCMPSGSVKKYLFNMLRGA